MHAQAKAIKEEQFSAASVAAAQGPELHQNATSTAETEKPAAKPVQDPKVLADHIE